MTLLNLQHDLALEGKHLSDVLKVGDKVIHNGFYFSDSDFFIKNEEYKIKAITETRIKLSSRMSFMSIDIFPNGLNAFILKEEE